VGVYDKETDQLASDGRSCCRLETSRRGVLVSAMHGLVAVYTDRIHRHAGGLHHAEAMARMAIKRPGSIPEKEVHSAVIKLTASG